MSTSSSLESLQEKKIQLFWRAGEKRLGPQAPSAHHERIRIMLITTAEALWLFFFFCYRSVAVGACGFHAQHASQVVLIFY